MDAVAIAGPTSVVRATSTSDATARVTAAASTSLVAAIDQVRSMLVRELSLCAARDRSARLPWLREVLDAKGLSSTRSAAILLELSNELRVGSSPRLATTLALMVLLPHLQTALPRVWIWKERPRRCAAWMHDVVTSAVEALHAPEFPRDPSRLVDELVRYTLNRCRAQWRAETRHDRLLRKIGEATTRSHGMALGAPHAAELAAERLSGGARDAVDVERAEVRDQLRAWVAQGVVRPRDAALFWDIVVEEQSLDAVCAAAGLSEAAARKAFQRVVRRLRTHHAACTGQDARVA